MPVKISKLKRNALEALSGKWGIAVLLNFLVFLLSTFLPTVVEIGLSGGFMEWSMQESPSPIAAIGSFVVTFLLIPLSIASTWFYLAMARHHRPKIVNVFSIYGDIGMSIKLISTSIVMGIFVFLWSLLLIIPGIIKTLAYSQAFYLLRDHPEYSILEAIRESRKRMKGYKWKYFLLQLSFIGWGFLAVISLGIGFLWLIPYMATTNAGFYNDFIASGTDTDDDTPTAVTV